jgi:subtilisin family serine protease
LGNPTYLGNPQVNTALPAAPPTEALEAKNAAKVVKVAVLDTGLETDPGPPRRPRHSDLRQHVLIQPNWSTGDDVKTPVDEDNLDVDGDGMLDRAAGHGTFISGIVRRLAPQTEIHVEGVLSSFGDGDDFEIAKGIEDLLARVAPELVNLSFGAFTENDEPPLTLANAVSALQSSGAVVVASAGNDGSCRVAWPAALPGVIAVGALDCTNWAWFSNHGPWVDASAPGVDVLSTFVWHDGPASPFNSLDPDLYNGWATWSGTSFAAPKVVAAIANEMVRTGCTASEAADAVVFARGLFRVPDLGTVVNLV